MSGIIFALLCAVFVAFSQLALRKSYQELPPSVAFLFDVIFGLLIWVPLAAYMGISGSVSWGGEAIFFAVVSVILSEAIVIASCSNLAPPKGLVLQPQIRVRYNPKRLKNFV